ncbi:hypothetical protein GCM10009608_62480 [Pseudonocardia alaniniphila]
MAQMTAPGQPARWRGGGERGGDEAADRAGATGLITVVVCGLAGDEMPGKQRLELRAEPLHAAATPSAAAASGGCGLLMVPAMRLLAAYLRLPFMPGMGVHCRLGGSAVARADPASNARRRTGSGRGPRGAAGGQVRCCGRQTQLHRM